MQPTLKRFLEKHSPRLAQILARFGQELYTHRIPLAHFCWILGTFGLFYTLLRWSGDQMPYPRGMLQVFTGILFIGFGAVKSNKWSQEEKELLNRIEQEEEPPRKVAIAEDVKRYHYSKN